MAWSVLACEPASDDTLRLVHTKEYLEATKAAGSGEEGDWSRFGYGPGDNPIFDRMHEAGALVAGASVEAARAVWSGERLHAFNAAGGLHHAMPARASGFCVYDDPAVAIAWLLREGAERIAYVDVDVHHGDGVQAIFWDEPRVLTISIHEYFPGMFFPGTGAVVGAWWPERGGVRDQRAASAGDGRRRVARRVPGGRPARRRAVRSGRARDPARVRHARHRPARAAPAHHARLPRVRRRSSTRWRTEPPPVAGSRPAAAATSGRASSRAPGPSPSPRWPARSTTCPTSSRRRSSRRRSGEPGAEVPATFSEPDLGPGRGDDEARAAADEVRRLVLEP